MELVETVYAERRDRRLRWIAIGTLVLLTQAVGVIVSVRERFFDPWLFAMIGAPALGVAAGILARQLLEGAIPLNRPSRRDDLRIVRLSGGKRSP